MLWRLRSYRNIIIIIIIIIITKRLMDHLQSVLNAAARLVCNSRKYDRISPLLHDLHWLRVPVLMPQPDST